VVDTDELAKIQALKQFYFVPFYREIVEQHPEGIDSRVVKSQVAQLLIERFDIDVRDATLFGSNANGSRADQWANNLVSNRELDKFMLVAHRGRGQGATLWPGTLDNSVPDRRQPGSLDGAEVVSLNKRPPSLMRASAGSVWRRSRELANLVRIRGGYKCAIDGPDCVEFEGRDSNPYIEVHHIVPIAFQINTTVNLDRTGNMAPLCAGCHKRIHRGAVGPAGEVMDEMLQWLGRTHGVSFEEANEDLGLGVSADDLIAMYGAMRADI
jgi:hypothetical protein